jgi:hypothetical protein
MVALGIALLLVLVLAGGTSAATGITNPAALVDLVRLHQVTEQYHAVEAALGGMGIHYVNLARLEDPATNLLEPEILLYVESGGRLKLVGVEYMTEVGTLNDPVPNPAPPAPVLFGRPFDGPMPGHEEGMAPHYDLHAWLWQANPAGIFAIFNPTVSCD